MNIYSIPLNLINILNALIGAIRHISRIYPVWYIWGAFISYVRAFGFIYSNPYVAECEYRWIWLWRIHNKILMYNIIYLYLLIWLEKITKLQSVYFISFSPQKANCRKQPSGTTANVALYFLYMCEHIVIHRAYSTLESQQINEHIFRLPFKLK